MCGRYRLSRRKQLIEEYFDASGEDDWDPRYNIAPTQPVPVITYIDSGGNGTLASAWSTVRSQTGALKFFPPK